MYPLHKVKAHQVHDEVELYGEVNDEEDTAPAVPGVGRHHHVRKAAGKQRLSPYLKYLNREFKSVLKAAVFKPGTCVSI